MKRTICVALAAVFMCLSMGCEDSGSTISKARQELRYFRDARTDLCFAYTWGGDDYGGPGLATVPCEKVATFLEK
ncbi:MAG: hypothetical protein NTU97_00150 [Candidatus Magasanikbacteria bacterium]|nr:hypothetical protein [Candidatus Magasanikbacteria bacterium]